MTTIKQEILTEMDKKEALYAELSDQIWAAAELRFDCPKSADLLCEALEKEGFDIQRGVAGMENAFVATWGTSGPVIGFLGEYDALPALSQVANQSKKEPLVEGGPGHGCGHQALGVGVLAGAVGLKTYLEKTGKQAVIKYFGCPGEESGSGKAFMAREGVFAGTAACLTWHPMCETRIWTNSALANYQLYFHFKGKSSHASASPHLGRSALDACELMNVGVNYLREHIVPEARVHYAYIDVGGNAPNVVQPTGSLLYFIRAPKSSEVKDITSRVIDIAKGAALMTGTSMEVQWDSACSEYIPNEVLGKAAYENLIALGALKFTQEEIHEAEIYTAQLDEASKKTFVDKLQRLSGASAEYAAFIAEKPLVDDILPFYTPSFPMPGSTDVGDASWVSPTMQFTIGMYPAGTLPHSWQWTAFGKSSVVHKAALHAGKVMALTAIDLIEQPDIMKKAKDEWLSRLNGEVYQSAFPKEVMPK